MDIKSLLNTDQDGGEHPPGSGFPRSNTVAPSHNQEQVTTASPLGTGDSTAATMPRTVEPDALTTSPHTLNQCQREMIHQSREVNPSLQHILAQSMPVPTAPLNQPCQLSNRLPNATPLWARYLAGLTKAEECQEAFLGLPGRLIQVQIDYTLASRKADEKRKRNAKALTRHRKRRKEREEDRARFEEMKQAKSRREHNREGHWGFTEQVLVSQAPSASPRSSTANYYAEGSHGTPSAMYHARLYQGHIYD